MADLKEKIKSLCIEKGISVNAMEQDLGFARGYIYKLNNSAPSVEKAKKIADYFGVTVDSLLAEDSEAG